MSDLLQSRYRLIEMIGQGSMGVVWRAEDTVLEREIALKELRPVPGVDPEEAMSRFLVEARAAARLSHPNIVNIHDVFTDGDRVLIAMELVRGPTLDQVVRRSGAQPASVVRAVMAQVAQALAVAHAAGVVHRDLKPENVFWTAEERAVVADFGLARIGAGRGTVEGTVMGTPGYMAPEQVRGLVVGPAADVFSWGALAYELATCRPPFGEPLETDQSVLAYRIVHEDLVPLELFKDPHLAGVVMHALAKDWQERPADGRALVDAISGGAVSRRLDVVPPVKAPEPVATSEAGATPEAVSTADSPAAVAPVEPAPEEATKARGRHPRSGAVFVLAAGVLLGLLLLIAVGGDVTPANGTLAPGTVMINGVDPASQPETELDLSRPLAVTGTAEPDTVRRVKLAFSAIGVPLGSGASDVVQQKDGTFRIGIDATDTARFFVGGRVTATITLLGPDDEFGVPDEQALHFPAASTQSALRTVPAAIAIILTLFVLIYLKTSIYWLVVGDRVSFETTNLLIGGALLGCTVVLLAWLAGAPEPDAQVLAVCAGLGVAFSVAASLAALQAAKRRRARRQRSGESP